MNEQKQVEAIERVQRYIDDHLQEKITLLDLARVANHSPAHTTRLFKRFTGLSAFEYIRRLRLSQAALQLRDQPRKVIDVAFDFVFDSHEGFSRAFSNAFGIAPKKYAQQPRPIKLFMPENVRQLYLNQQKRNAVMTETNNTIFVQVIDKAARKMLVKRASTARQYFEFCEQTGSDVWGVLCSVKEALAEPVGLWLPESMRPEGTSEYIQGVEVPLDYDQELPEGYELAEFPACQLMFFQGAPFKDEDFTIAIEQIWQAIDDYDPTLYGFDWAPELGPRVQLEPQGYRGYIEARPVRPLNAKL